MSEKINIPSSRSDRFFAWCDTNNARRTLFVLAMALLWLLVANAVTNISVISAASAALLVVVFLLASVIKVKRG